MSSDNPTAADSSQYMIGGRSFHQTKATETRLRLRVGLAGKVRDILDGI
jgi:hypothetical protein